MTKTKITTEPHLKHVQNVTFSGIPSVYASLIAKPNITMVGIHWSHLIYGFTFHDFSYLLALSL